MKRPWWSYWFSYLMGWTGGLLGVWATDIFDIELCWYVPVMLALSFGIITERSGERRYSTEIP